MRNERKWPVTEPPLNETQTSGHVNEREGRRHTGLAQTKTPADDGTGSVGSVSSRYSDSPDRVWRRTEFVHDLRARRRVSRELDQLCGIESNPVDSGTIFILADQVRRLVLVVGGDGEGDRYAEMALGVAERRAAGRELLAEIRAASAADTEEKLNGSNLRGHVADRWRWAA